jgi:ribonuclease H2 subunit A
MNPFPSAIVCSPVPGACKLSSCVLGIDEAGRGPFLGPLVYSCAYWPEDDDARLSRLGFDDSKAITDAKRRALFSALKATGEIGYVTISIPPEALSFQMLRRQPVSLNKISHDAAEQLVRLVLDAGVTLSHVYVDTVGDAGYYASHLTRQFNNRVQFTVCPKADSLYKIVSAASICAKVTRDDALGATGFAFREPYFAAKCLPPSMGAGGGVSDKSTTAPPAEGFVESSAGLDAGASDEDDDMDGEDASAAAAEPPLAPATAAWVPTHPCTAGSGYPGDPLTKRWIRENMDVLFGWPSVARFSWSTAKAALKGPGAVKVTWDGGDDDDGASLAALVDAKQQRLSAFFSASSASRPATGRFFAKRGIEHVSGHDACL